ncbi:uncharacterized protein LOC126681803 [Mercurialis annua]|uniref:uncharacterized protein LOC126681803 n=1 Tax=Mercurialis annua TaxID=3986 RepID=UPI00215F39F9|nr:uncharacterized protein LOC126681803 [Mercurialis annua]
MKLGRDNAADQFKKWINEANVSELKKVGNKFTWTNNQNGLDRIWRTIDWKRGREGKWGLNFTMPGVSIRILWIRIPEAKKTRKELRKLSEKEFSSISIRVNKMRETLCKLQSDLQNNPSNTVLMDEERAVNNHFLKLIKWEESILRQKSRIKLINLGDRNTKFFHIYMNQRTSRKRIIRFKVNGEYIEDSEQLKEGIVHHYRKFFRDKLEDRRNVNPMVFEKGLVVNRE